MSPSRAGLQPVRRPGAWPPWTAAGWGTAWATRSAANARPGPAPLIEFVTPGILLRRLLADPGLETAGAVILDEVHERGLETDLLLGMLAEVRQLRGDLTLVAMSATLDAPRFAALIWAESGGSGDHDGGGPAPVVDCPSALYPLEVDWVPAAGAAAG